MWGGLQSVGPQPMRKFAAAFADCVLALAEFVPDSASPGRSMAETIVGLEPIHKFAAYLADCVLTLAEFVPVLALLAEVRLKPAPNWTNVYRSCKLVRAIWSTSGLISPKPAWSSARNYRSKTRRDASRLARRSSRFKVMDENGTRVRT